MLLIVCPPSSDLSELFLVHLRSPFASYSICLCIVLSRVSLLVFMGKACRMKCLAFFVEIEVRQLGNFFIFYFVQAFFRY